DAFVRSTDNLQWLCVTLEGMFGVTFADSIDLLTRKWGVDGLRHLYAALRKAPPGHVEQAVTRLEFTDGSPEYKNGRISMPEFKRNTVRELDKRHRKLGKKSSIGGKVLMDRSRYSRALRGNDAFTHNTLHELGHGVDEEFKVMDTKMHEPDFGG